MPTPTQPDLYHVAALLDQIAVRLETWPTGDEFLRHALAKETHSLAAEVRALAEQSQKPGGETA